MKKEAFEAYCLSFPHTHFDELWGACHVYKVAGKMFAMAVGNGETWQDVYQFKATPMSFELLVDQGLARPAPYSARNGWVELTSPDALSDDELKSYVAIAFGLVVEKFTARKRRELKLGEFAE